MTDRTELAKQLREHAGHLKRLAAFHRELGARGSAWIAKDHEAKAANLTAAADLIEREAVVPERVRMPEPMTWEEISDFAMEMVKGEKSIDWVARAIEAEVLRRVREANNG